MRVMACHNYYQQAGGEDQSFAAEADLLESHGHDVHRYTVHNDAIDQMGRLEIARKTIYNRDSYRAIQKLLRSYRPDILHCTNIFPLISPAIYYAAKAEKVPVVQSLRNFRLLCPSACLLRDGRVCEDCLAKTIKWPAVRHKCYRKSRAGSFVVAAMLATHRLLGTWTRTVDRYFAMTEFARQKFIQGGLPADKVDVKPNFLFGDPGAGSGQGKYALFVGRLSQEKGLDALLSAWKQLRQPIPLRIVGDGPMAAEVKQAAEENDNVTWMGRLDTSQVLSMVGDARCLVLPSSWYEGFPRVIIEAYATGTPVIAFRLGSMQEIIIHGQTGYLVEPENIPALAKTVDDFFSCDPATEQLLRASAREMFLSKYSAETNYRLLMEIYARARGQELTAPSQEDVAETRSSASTLAGPKGQKYGAYEKEKSRRSIP